MNQMSQQHPSTRRFSRVTHGKHRLLRSKLGELCPKLIAALWGKESVQQALALVYDSIESALEGPSHASYDLRHLVRK